MNTASIKPVAPAIKSTVNAFCHPLVLNRQLTIAAQQALNMSECPFTFMKIKMNTDTRTPTADKAKLFAKNSITSPPNGLIVYYNISLQLPVSCKKTNLENKMSKVFVNMPKANNAGRRYHRCNPHRCG
jgi:hypothetical protein